MNYDSREGNWDDAQQSKGSKLLLIKSVLRSNEDFSKKPLKCKF